MCIPGGEHDVRGIINETKIETWGRGEEFRRSYVSILCSISRAEKYEHKYKHTKTMQRCATDDLVNTAKTITCAV